MELIPAIDLKEGRVVRLLHGDFEQETQYSQAPLALYERYVSLGAHRLHVVDLDAARGQNDNALLWKSLASDGRLKVQLGGGLRSLFAIEQAIASGVDRVVLGSVAVTDPALVRTVLREFGPDHIVLALDVRLDETHIPRLATHGWIQQSQTSLWDAVAAYTEDGLRHVLCTDVSRDGAMSGPNLSLYQEAVNRCPTIAWQASGGVRHLDDLHVLAAIGVAGAISGRALLEGHLDTEGLQPFLPAA